MCLRQRARQQGDKLVRHEMEADANQQFSDLSRGDNGIVREGVRIRMRLDEEGGKEEEFRTRGRWRDRAS